MSVKISIPFKEGDYNKIENKLENGYEVGFFNQLILKTGMKINKLGLIPTKNKKYKIECYVICDQPYPTNEALKKLRDDISEKYDVKEYDIDDNYTSFYFSKGDIHFESNFNSTNYPPFFIFKGDEKDFEVKNDVGISMDVLETVLNSYNEFMRWDDFYEDEEISPELLFFEPKSKSGEKSKVGGEITSQDDYKDVLRRTILHSKPTTTFDDIGGCVEVKEELMLLSYGLENPEDFKEYDLRLPRGILLHGPPGTGKTMLAKAFAKKVNATFLNVRASDIDSKWVGESGKYMNALFDLAKEEAPSVIVVNEIDSLVGSRDYDIHNSDRKKLGIMLDRMDGMEEMERVVVFGTTNHIQSIDSALLRPGRFDDIIEVGLPDRDATQKIYEMQLRGRKIAEGIDYGQLAGKSVNSKGEGFSGAKIEAVFINAKKEKMKLIVFKGIKNPGLIDTEFMLQMIEDYKKKESKLDNGMKDRSYMYL